MDKNKYPSSSKKTIDWGAIDKSIEEDKLEGDAALVYVEEFGEPPLLLVSEIRAERLAQNPKPLLNPTPLRCAGP